MGEKSWCHLIRAHKGDSWCLSWSHASKLVAAAGCDNVDIRCNASDIDSWLEGDKTTHLEGKEDEYRPILDCLREKCWHTRVELLTSCNIASKESCNDKELAYIDKMAVKDAAAQTKEAGRLQKTIDAGMADDKKQWAMIRVAILQALTSPSGKSPNAEL